MQNSSIDKSVVNDSSENNENNKEATLERFKATMRQLLTLMKKEGASDLILTVGFPPALKINGEVKPIENLHALTRLHTVNFVSATMNEKQQKEFTHTNECNYAISSEGIGRFRVNAFKQRDSIGMVIRVINTDIPSLESLNVPATLKNIVMEKRGLIIVVGATGSGKSSTLAAMIGHRNNNHAGHIVTLEDPIEFIHNHAKSIVSQREIGVDTDNWEIGLKNALRQAPDVILIGEIRDRDTMEHAIAFSETGHLCLATLHANNANQALDRIINFFPHDRRQQLLMDLSFNLKAIISQRLIPSLKVGRVPAVEVLLNTPRMADIIKKDKIDLIKETMKQSTEVGMQTFDKALFSLYEERKISLENALRHADSSNDLELDIKLHSKIFVKTKTDTLKISEL